MCFRLDQFADHYYFILYYLQKIKSTHDFQLLLHPPHLQLLYMLVSVLNLMCLTSSHLGYKYHVFGSY
jgi:hypothetical protein